MEIAMRRKKTSIILEITDESALGLRGRQSVRTTFKLSERAISALSILAGQMGIKQKSLFDHLMDDVPALKAIAREFETFPEKEQRVTKTFVISRKTLEILETVSAQYQTPRDALVEYSIQRILPLVEREKARHRKRVEIESQLAEHVRQGAGLLRQAVEELGEDDPVVQEMYSMLRSNDLAYKRIRDYVQKGKKVEEF